MGRYCLPLYEKVIYCPRGRILSGWDEFEPLADAVVVKSKVSDLDQAWQAEYSAEAVGVTSWSLCQGQPRWTAHPVSFLPPPATTDSKKALASHAICDRNNLSGTDNRPRPVAS